MAELFDRAMKFVLLGERLAVLATNLSKLQDRADDHEKRLIRLETIVEIVRPDGTTLRILPGATK
jgi:hypothetical protein